jgi:DNA-binding response OmpR family regulator
MVEDDEGHARLIEKNIRRASVSNEIKHFISGTAAMSYLLQPEVRMNGPLLLLLDLNLPDMSGTELLGRLRICSCGPGEAGAIQPMEVRSGKGVAPAR